MTKYGYFLAAEEHEPQEPDPGVHLDGISAFTTAGFDEVYIGQAGFFEFYAGQVLPRLRGNRP
jgi:hypothetical protein